MTNKLILLVEDNKTEEALMLHALRKSNVGCDVVVARDGAEALHLLFPEMSLSGKTNALPSIVFLDLNLPKVSGLEVLRRIRSHDSTRILPVIILSSSDIEQDVRSSYLFGANSYIRKRVNFDQFSEAVKQLASYWLILNESPPMSAHERAIAGQYQASCARR